MTLQLSPFSRTKYAAALQAAIGTPCTVLLYPASVTMPTPTSTLPAGFLAQLTSVGTTVNGSGVMVLNGGTLSVNATATGTVAWFAIRSSGKPDRFIVSDSVSTSAGKALTVSTLDATAGQPIALTALSIAT